ncbi:ABC transporter substrate-binding protein [Acetobacter sp. DsW_063]|uniref:ABC transporter substrate-binding protein n=1 Tax=Acetobacter sp. DsW_063 TaxID=1514894 RepID=UPI000A369CB6|nr:ABC transporter substrate-binding protein [Acetobacter sp. DsW_063]OUJ12586.1 hypothetical protein HK28_03445 [Acetobacter sp. DsW_063]
MDEQQRATSMSDMPVIKRRSFLSGATALALTGTCSPRARAASDRELTVSYQQSSILFQVARANNLINPRLEKIGFSPVWSILSTSAAQIGQVDYVSDVAEAVPVVVLPLFPSLAIYAVEGPSPSALGIVARKDRGITSFSDLRGRRVAVGKTGSAFDFLVQALASVNLKLSDIHPIYVPESACLQAFRTGAIDAWATFDPFFSFATALPEAHLLGDGSAVKMRYNRYYLADSAFVQAHPETVTTFRSVLNDAAAWVRDNKSAAASLLSRQWENMSIDTVTSVLQHRTFSIRSPDASDLDTLQAINDRYAAQGLVPPGRDFKATKIIA